MKPQTVKQIVDLMKREPFKYIALHDAEGNIVVPFNTPKIKIEARKKEIEGKLNSSIEPDGLYYFCYKNQIENNGIKKIPVVKGGGAVNVSEIQPISEKPEKVIREKVIVEENVLSYSQALDYIQKIATLEVEVEKLKQENEMLREELEEIDDDETLNEGAPGANVNAAGEWVKNLMETLTPVADKYFELREREIALQENGMGAVAPVRAPVVNRPITVTRPTTQTTVQPVRPPSTTQPQQQQPQTNIYAQPATAPGATTGATQPGEEDTTELENQLMQLPVEDLEQIYEGLKRAGNFKELQKFLRIMKGGRPDDLAKIISKDLPQQ